MLDIALEKVSDNKPSSVVKKFGTMIVFWQEGPVAAPLIQHAGSSWGVGPHISKYFYKGSRYIEIS